MKTLLRPLRHSIIALIASAALASPAAEPISDNALRDNESLVQIAILLDTSNSMDGLIDQAKSQIIKELQEVRLGKRAMAGYKSNIAS